MIRAETNEIENRRRWKILFKNTVLWKDQIEKPIARLLREKTQITSIRNEGGCHWGSCQSQNADGGVAWSSLYACVWASWWKEPVQEKREIHQNSTEMN